MSYRIITDNCCDFPADMYDDLNLSVVPLVVRFQDKEVSQYSEKWLKKMYAGLRAGASASTSAANPETWAAAIRPVLEQGEDAFLRPGMLVKAGFQCGQVFFHGNTSKKYSIRRLSGGSHGR